MIDSGRSCPPITTPLIYESTPPHPLRPPSSHTVPLLPPRLLQPTDTHTLVPSKHHLYSHCGPPLTPRPPLPRRRARRPPSGSYGPSGAGNRGRPAPFFSMGSGAPPAATPRERFRGSDPGHTAQGAMPAHCPWQGSTLGSGAERVRVRVRERREREREGERERVRESRKRGREGGRERDYRERDCSPAHTAAASVLFRRHSDPSHTAL